jgi:hypothetical protein
MVLRKGKEMKIMQNDEIVKTAYPKNMKEAEKPEGSDFEKILKESIDHFPGVETGPQKPPMINNISGVQINSLLTAKSNDVERTERFLNILDRYQQKLNNPQATLRDLYPLVQEMEVEKESLIPVFESLPDGDELKDILNQVLITSSVEIMKFNRGYYINS